MARISPAKALATANYAPRKIPGPSDGELSSVVATLVTPIEFAEAIAEVDRATARVFLSFATRMASYAVRTKNEVWIKHGLVAAQLAFAGEDDRDVTLTLSLLFRASELIGADAPRLFRQAASLAPIGVGAAITDFAERSEPLRSIEDMGFREGHDDDGFRFMPKR